ncbi:MAG TPA: hypothetical protein VGJ15_07065 [Pirellulales bacterium]|jgi:ribose/xylose/arabinose/galactoside ABC-type transport system permease subunit
MNRWMKSLWNVGRPLLAVFLVVALFAVVDVAMHGNNARFVSKENLQAITFHGASVAICSLGMLLVIIAGGIDLSAGVALALCATILAWGIREDVGFMLAHGSNVPGAMAKLKSAADELEETKTAGNSAQIKQAQAELDRRRQTLAEMMEIKLGQLQAIAKNAAESKSVSETELARLDTKVSELSSGLATMRDLNSPPPTDPAWLQSLPNAASSGWLAVLMAVVAGMLCGFFNGLLIVFLRVVPFIATLGTMTIYLGLALIVADETSIRPTIMQRPEWLAELSVNRPDPSWLVVSKAVWLALIISALIACLLRYTVFGRYVFALGSNESTARLCGINVPLVKISIYTLAGLLVGIASTCFFARLNNGSPTAGTGMELKFIAAVVIGGGSLSGGRGTVLGTLAGTVIMGVIDSGGNLVGLKNPMQYIVLGAIIVAAVAIDQFRQQRN